MSNPAFGYWPDELDPARTQYLRPGTDLLWPPRTSERYEPHICPSVKAERAESGRGIPRDDRGFKTDRITFMAANAFIRGGSCLL